MSRFYQGKIIPIATYLRGGGWGENSSLHHHLSRKGVHLTPCTPLATGLDARNTHTFFNQSLNMKSPLDIRLQFLNVTFI